MDLVSRWPHELGPLQKSLGLFDGALVKASKAALPKLREDGVEGLQRLLAQIIAVIIDPMDMLQTVRKTSERFIKLSEMIFKRILMQAGEARGVDFGGDHYLDISIENIEGEGRSNSGQLGVAIATF